MGKIKRRQNAIDRLPPDVKEKVDDMIKSNCTYCEVVNYIKDSGYKASLSTVQRYAVTLTQSLQTLRMIQENFSIINEEMEHYKNTDCMEAILMLLTNKLLNGLIVFLMNRFRNLIQPNS